MQATRYPSAAAFRAYQLANLHFPQMDVGVVSLVGDALFHGTLDDIEAGLNADFSAAQKARLMTAMARAHRANRVRALPASSDRAGAEPRHVVTDARLSLLWLNIRLYIAQAISEFACANDEGLTPLLLKPDTDHSLAVAELLGILADARVRMGMAEIFTALVGCLRGPEASALARGYRDAIRQSGAGYADAELSRIRTEVEHQLSTLLGRATIPISRPVGELILARRWIPLRRSPVALALVAVANRSPQAAPRIAS